MKIIVKLESSKCESSHSFNLEDFDISQSDWDKLSDVEKGDIIKEAVYNIQEQPFWELDGWKESD